MGCFSYICNKCGKQIWNDKYNICVGEKVILSRIAKGVVLEVMSGKYTGYGTTHVGENSYHYTIVDGKRIPVENETDTHEWVSEDWVIMVEEHFNNDSDTGIGAVHVDCEEEDFETTPSNDCPNQGWANEEYEDYYEETEEDE